MISKFFDHTFALCKYLKGKKADSIVSEVKLNSFENVNENEYLLIPKIGGR